MIALNVRCDSLESCLIAGLRGKIALLVTGTVNSNKIVDSLQKDKIDK